jgi:hypothetical protein
VLSRNLNIDASSKTAELYIVIVDVIDYYRLSEFIIMLRLLLLTELGTLS